MKQQKSVEQIEAIIVEHVTRSTGLPANDIERTRRFDHYGLDSMDAVSLVGDLEDFIGRPLSAALPYSYPTIESLARRLHEGASD